MPMPEFQPQGLDVQPQPVPEMMPLPSLPPMQGSDPNDPMAQIANMGTKRLMALLMKKKQAGAEDAQDAWEEGGSL